MLELDRVGVDVIPDFSLKMFLRCDREIRPLLQSCLSTAPIESPNTSDWIFANIYLATSNPRANMGSKINRQYESRISGHRNAKRLQFRLCQTAKIENFRAFIAISASLMNIRRISRTKRICDLPLRTFHCNGTTALPVCLHSGNCKAPNGMCGMCGMCGSRIETGKRIVNGLDGDE